MVLEISLTSLTTVEGWGGRAGGLKKALLGGIGGGFSSSEKGSAYSSSSSYKSEYSA